MKSAVLTGIGGQGTVLAAKILAQAAQARGWDVRTAETIGMAQRGGSVVSHVRMGDCGEEVASPLVSRAQADVLIAFEPGEGLRMRDILKPDGTMVTASRVVQPVTASLSRDPYRAQPILDELGVRARATIMVGEAAAAGALARDGESTSGAGRNGVPGSTLYVVDEGPLLEHIGNAKALNIVLLTVAIKAGALGIRVDEFKEAVAACVKPQFRSLNRAAIDAVCTLMGA